MLLGFLKADNKCCVRSDNPDFDVISRDLRSCIRCTQERGVLSARSRTEESENISLIVESWLSFFRNDNFPISVGAGRGRRPLGPPGIVILSVTNSCELQDEESKVPN